MKPTSRLRTRARSDNERLDKGLPFRRYSPLVGVSRRPRMESNAGLPQRIRRRSLSE